MSNSCQSSATVQKAIDSLPVVVPRTPTMIGRANQEVNPSRTTEQNTCDGWAVLSAASDLVGRSSPRADHRRILQASLPSSASEYIDLEDLGEALIPGSASSIETELTEPTQCENIRVEAPAPPPSAPLSSDNAAND